MSDSELNLRDFRCALSQFPTGVCVVTTRDCSGEPVGITASSFNSVSIDPPLILWSIDKNIFSAKIFERSKNFAVNVLCQDQFDISNLFAKQGTDKFKGIIFESGIGEVPLLQNCSAQFECESWNVYEGGDHLIIVGEVLNYRYVKENSPLVFACGSYAIHSQHPSVIC